MEKEKEKARGSTDTATHAGNGATKAHGVRKEKEKGSQEVASGNKKAESHGTLKANHTKEKENQC